MVVNKIIPESELIITFSHSGGAGGQNVNKVATKATVRWNVGASALFNPEDKQKIRLALGNRLNKNDQLVINSAEERSQAQNRAKAIARLRTLVARAVRPHKARKPVKFTRAAKEKRLQEKKRRGQIKQQRQSRSSHPDA